MGFSGMPPADKPRHRSGYSTEETLLVQSACLTVAVTLGAYLDDLCIVGGLVPSLLIDHGADSPLTDEDPHPGTNDLDIALAVALADDKRYAEISARLRQEGFGPDKNQSGNPTVQRWRMEGFKVTIDFLMQPLEAQPALRVQHLEPDFGALAMPGVELAFDERTSVELVGHTLHGEQVTRSVPVCGPGAFVVLKALAFGDRAENKDAYDLVYVLRGTKGGPGTVAQRLREHAAEHRDIVQRALALLARDFTTVDGIGPRRAAEFTIVNPADLDTAAADALGHVRDLLDACGDCGLTF